MGDRIIDEASQCRREEALPVLLRGKRVASAGHAAMVTASMRGVPLFATLPRQDSLPHGLMAPQNGALAATNFSEWLKQTIEKRNGK